MSATITKGQTFGATELVTNTKLNNLVDNATISGIINAEISASAAIVGSKLDLSVPGIIGATTPAAIATNATNATTLIAASLINPAALITSFSFLISTSSSVENT